MAETSARSSLQSPAALVRSAAEKAGQATAAAAGASAGPRRPAGVRGGATAADTRDPGNDGAAAPRAAAVRGEDEAQLDALAAAFGIEAEFVDALGVVQRATDATKCRLLAAMDIRADSPEAIRAALEARTAEDWQLGLPPVAVTAAPAAVSLVLPRGCAAVDWRLTLEGGVELRGTASGAALPLLEISERGGAILERRTLTLAANVPPGYHRLALAGIGEPAALIVTPGKCWLPPAIVAGERLCGIAIQLYLLRSASNWGIGDFGDLRAFVARVAACGGDVVGLNPLHAMFADDPEHASPYSPASRLLLNVLNIDVAAVPECAYSPAAQERLAESDVRAALDAWRAADWLEYAPIAALKLEILGLVYETFAAGAAPERHAAFARFRAAASAAQERTYIFMALREHFAARGAEHAAWQTWPAEYRDPAAPAVARFAADNAGRVAFAAWLQWIADDQLAAAACAAEPMRVGLYRDLAVGADPAGAETWCNARTVVSRARIGAPPDIYNPQGQNWDLPPFGPSALRAEAYASFIELVRANMRHAGGLRIDHVMALQHAYWIPQGADPAGGAYVAYPLDDLVGIVALESHRAQCLVVGEDLGTVPAGFREHMQRANILSYRVLFFERDEAGAFESPAAYPHGALAVLGSHDLPTLAAWWSGADIALRQRIGLFDARTAAAARRTRADDRDAFTAALRAEGFFTAGGAAAPDTPGGLDGVDSAALFEAAHGFLARSAAALAVAQIDDITGESEPVNVPTTSDERPNWRRRLSLTLEELAADARFARTFAIFERANRVRR